MSRYIDKDLLIKELNEFVKAEEQGYGDSITVVLNTIVDMPEVDVVEIVHCKDCMWWEKGHDSLQGRCALHQSYPTGGWYCANAEAKRGAWVDNGIAMECSICGKAIVVEQGTAEMNYCPHCGVKMDADCY